MWQETLFSSFAPDPNSQPSSHNYYHHLDLTLFTLVLCVYRTKIVLGNVQGYIS